MSILAQRQFNSTTLAEAALNCLRNSPYKVLKRVSCECRNGVLFLRGRLFSFHEKHVAQQTVSTLDGIERVVNEIEVR